MEADEATVIHNSQIPCYIRHSWKYTFRVGLIPILSGNSRYVVSVVLSCKISNYIILRYGLHKTCLSSYNSTKYMSTAY